MEQAHTRKAGGHAIVIGGSMAGLLAARALAGYYEQVTVIERDSFPTTSEPRKGVPQGKQPHLLLPHGRQSLEKLFPGFTEELLACGGLEVNSQTTLVFQEGGYLARFQAEMTAVSQSRPLLESVVRRRLLALPDVAAIEQCDVLGLTTSADHSRVTGVRLIRRQAGSAEELLDADLVVDAAGRGSRLMNWLEGLGYPRPAEQQLRVDIVYTSRHYRRQPGHFPDGANPILISPTPQQPRGGLILAEEGDRWHVVVFGYLGDHAGRDEQSFVEFARSLPAPDVYHLLQSAEPLTALVQYRFRGSQRRHYQKLARFPEGLLVFGDALCSFNPIYGQGITVAALEALALQACLAQGTDQLAQRFWRQAGPIVDQAWEIATGGDLNVLRVKGSRSVKDRFANWYLGKLVAAAQQDPMVTLAFYNFLNFLATSSSLMQPGIVLRVLWGNLRPSSATEINGSSGIQGVDKS
jgi:2-polyprenyl-6-methoxyphenol hydroxylase-like FAD-dependent oxidoreductase